MASSSALRPRAGHVAGHARLSKPSRLLGSTLAHAGQVLRAPNPRRRETPPEELISPVLHDDHQPGSDHGHSTQLAHLPDSNGSSHIAPIEPAMPKQVLWRFVVPQYVTAFGEYLKVVGNIPELGQWDLGNAPPMKWNEGHRWVLETSLPIGCDFEFKVVALQHGNVRWEQGINRIIQSSDGVTGAPVELVINLTCQFGLTTETGMELVLNKSRVQESYELASATLELLGKRRERLAKALQELAKKGVPVAEQQEEAARLEAAVSTQAQCLSELGSLVANARPSEDGESLLLNMIGGKVVLPKEVSSLAWTQAKSVALVLEGAQQNTPALPQPAAAPAAETVSNNGHVATEVQNGHVAERHVEEEVKQPPAVATSMAGITILPYEEAKVEPVRRMSLLDTLIASYGNIVTYNGNNGTGEASKMSENSSKTGVGKADGRVPLSKVAASAALSGTPNMESIVSSSMESDSEMDVDDAMAAAAYASLSSRKWAKRRSDRQIKAEQDAIAAAVAAYQTAYSPVKPTSDAATVSFEAATADSPANEPKQADMPVLASVTAAVASAAGAVTSTVGNLVSSFENYEQQRQPDAPGLTLADLVTDKSAPEQASSPEQATEPVAAVEQVVEDAVPALKEAKVEVPELSVESQGPEPVMIASTTEAEEQTETDSTDTSEDTAPTTEEPIAPVLEALTSTVAETAGLEVDVDSLEAGSDSHSTEAAIEALAGAAVAAAVVVDTTSPEALQAQETVDAAVLAGAASGSPAEETTQAALTNLLGGINSASLPPPQQTSSGALFFSEAVLSAITLPPPRPKPKKVKKAKRPSIWDNNRNGNGNGNGTYSQEERNRIADLALQLARLSSMITNELQSVVSTSDTAQKIDTWDRLDGMVQEAQALQEKLMGQAGISVSQEEELTQLQDLIKFAKEKLARRQSQLRNQIEAVP